MNRRTVGNQNRREMALWMIILAIKEDHMVQIEEYKTARNAWNKLCGRFAETSTTNRLRPYARIDGFLDGDETDTPVREMARNRTQMCASGE